MSNSIIRCVVDVFAKPESVEKVRAVLLKVVEDTRQEDGCLKQKLFENINDKFQFTFIEIWENEDAFEDHLQSEHIRKAGIDLKDDLNKVTDIKRYKYIKTDPDKIKDRRTSRFCVLI
jgi:quinol monooxygenase YgiN